MPVSVRPASTLSWYGALKKRAAKLKRQIWALFLAWKDPGTPVLARIVIAVTVAYAVSPIDLIPDFIPVLGQLDDLVILPLLIMLAIRLIPPAVTARTRREAWKHLASGDRFKTPAGTVASVVFVLIWVVLVLLIIKSFR
jgi:uncharacterized membrane protein YkvA (DUF1232 family)